MGAWGHGGMGAWGHGDMVDVTVINSLGNIIREFDHDPSNPVLVIDLNNESNGLYIIRVSSGSRTVQKKLSLLK